MSLLQETGRGASGQDFHVAQPAEAEPEVTLGSILERIGAAGVISVSDADSESAIEERYRAIVIAMVTNRTKDPLQIYHWVPVSEYVPDKKQRKNPAVHVSMGGERKYTGVPLSYRFPKEGAKLMVQTPVGDMPFLQFLRKLPDHPGHAVTFFRGTLKQTEFTYHPTKPAPRTIEVPNQHAKASAHQVQSKPVPVPAEVSDEERRHGRPMEIPRAILLFYKLSPADRMNILSRMPHKQRNALETMFYEDERGPHRRSNAELSGNPGTLHSHLLNAAQFIYQWIVVTEDGTVSRKKSQAEHFHEVMGIKSAPIGSDLSALLGHTEGNPGGKKKKKKMGWRR